MEESELLIEAVRILDTPVAAAVIFARCEFGFSEEMDHKVTAGNNFVVPRRTSAKPGGKTEFLIKGANLSEIPRRKYRLRTFHAHG
jgi:hypothetical protein